MQDKIQRNNTVFSFPLSKGKFEGLVLVGFLGNSIGSSIYYCRTSSCCMVCNVPSLGVGIAGLNIGPEVAIVVLLRHIIFGVVLGISVRRWKYWD